MCPAGQEGSRSCHKGMCPAGQGGQGAVPSSTGVTSEAHKHHVKTSFGKDTKSTFSSKPPRALPEVGVALQPHQHWEGCTASHQQSKRRLWQLLTREKLGNLGQI